MKHLSDKHLAILRRHMVEVIGIQVELTSEELGKASLDARVMAALERVPRHKFVPQQLAAFAYHDTPLPIGFDKTISQPFIAALMIDLLAPQAHEVVLEVGTGLGYQAAVLAELTAQVWSVEVVEEFAAAAKLRLKEIGILNVGIRAGDGSRGWVEHAPFDKILVAAATRRVPPALADQLKPGGRIVLPVGPADSQQLVVGEKDQSGDIALREIMPVRFTQLEVA